MSSNGSQRNLSFETLSPRAVLSAQTVLTFEAPVNELVINAHAPTNLADATAPYYRQVSWVEDNLIKTIGLHPSGSTFVNSLQALALPAGAIDSVIETAFDANSGVGYAVSENGDTQGVLWIEPNRPILLGKVQLLAGYQLEDETSIVALESNSTVRVVHFAVDGSELKSVTLDGNIYSNTIATRSGLIALGSEQSQPVAVHINEQLDVQYVSLDLPDGADFATPAGAVYVAGKNHFVGSSISPAGETRLVNWNEQGEVVEQPSLDRLQDVWVKKTSGAAMLIDTEQGVAVLVRDQSLASSLGIAADVPVVAADLPSLTKRGYTYSNFKKIVERDGELYLAFVATDASDALIHGLVVASSDRFPSAWQNPIDAMDVNMSGQVTPLDALLIINDLNALKARTLTARDLQQRLRQDASGDGILSPIDVLLVINRLNQRSKSGGEGEQSELQHVKVGVQSPFEDSKKNSREIEPTSIQVRDVGSRIKTEVSATCPSSSVYNAVRFSMSKAEGAKRSRSGEAYASSASSSGLGSGGCGYSRWLNP